MLVSEVWLREWVSPRLNTDELADRLTMAGLEVGSIEPAGDLSNKLVVGRIEEIAAHPDADRLRVCKVNVGRARNLTIVCGAANARQGLYTITALVGAELPGGMRISKTAVRGVTSSGMLCSASELGLEESSAGILDLAGKPAVGMLASTFFQLDDSILDLELTPNRGDCLSIRGVAREVAALTNSRLKKPVKSVEMAVQAVRDNDQRAAESVLMLKDSVRDLSERLLTRKAQRITEEDRDYLALMRLEMSFVDQMRRIYTLSKRIAKVVLPPVLAQRD